MGGKNKHIFGILKSYRIKGGIIHILWKFKQIIDEGFGDYNILAFDKIPQGRKPINGYERQIAIEDFNKNYVSD